MAEPLTIGNLRRDLVRLTFQEYFGIMPSEAALLVALVEAGPAGRQARELLYTSDSHRPARVGSVEVCVSRLRKVLDAEAIDTLPNRSYALTDIGRAECRKALVLMGQAMASAGEAA